MHPKTARLWSLTTAFVTIGLGPQAHASLTLIGSGNATGPNLVANSSFEIGTPGPGLANQRYWATGTPATPFLSIPSWTGTGQPNNYAIWGSDLATAPYQLRGSDVLPDGQVGVYFGNGEQVGVTPAPIFNPDFTVSFNSPPVFTGPLYSGPVSLSQIVPTHLNPATSYRLSFWVSGEEADIGTNPTPGIFGLRVSNTVVGDPIVYLSVPPGISSTIGKSHIYLFEFVPLNPAQPVTVEFLNFGHAGNPFAATEIVLDDVRVTRSGDIVPAEPTIDIKLTLTNTVVISWASHWTNFVLHANPVINSTNWKPLTNVVFGDPTSKWVVVEIDPTNNFFQLKK